MDRRHFLETLAAGLVAGGAAFPALQSVAGPLFVPVEKDEEGLTPLRRFFAVAIVSFHRKSTSKRNGSRLKAPFRLHTRWVRRIARVAAGHAGEHPSLRRRRPGRARWAGVRLRDLLDKAGMDPEARDVIFYGADEYESSVPVGEAMKKSSMLASR